MDVEDKGIARRTVLKAAAAGFVDQSLHHLTDFGLSIFMAAN